MTATRSAAVLFVSNGHGEDLAAAAILRHLPESVTILAYPLVGTGRAYPARVRLLDPRRDLPSGGFAMRSGRLRPIVEDVRAGWLRLLRDQWRTVASLRGTVSLAVAVGDPFALWIASRTRTSVVFVDAPQSVRHDPPRPVHRWMMRRLASVVYARDDETARWLARRGVPARSAGNPLMDGLDPTGGDLGVGDRRVVVLLPGSRAEAYRNFAAIARAARLLGRAVDDVAFVCALAPKLSAEQAARAAGGVLVDGRVRADGLEIFITTAFADALHRADVAIGMAGTANEQATGLGVPVVAFPGEGPQFTAQFLAQQSRLLGEALIAADSPEAAAEAARTLLADEGERRRRGEVGRARMGPPGGAAIAKEIAERLGPGNTGLGTGDPGPGRTR